MFRLFKAELKKIFMKPSIFVVTGLIITMLALSFFIYKPKEKTDYLDVYATITSGNAASFDNWYNNGFYNKPDDELKNQDAITYLSDANSMIDFYVEYDAETDGAVKLKDQWNSVETAYANFCEIYSSTKSNDTERDALLDLIKRFKNSYQNMLNSYKNSKIYFFVQKSTNDSITKSLYELNDTYSRLSTITSVQKGAKDAYVINSFRNSGILKNKGSNGKMINDLNSLAQFNPNKNMIATLKTYISTARTRLLSQIPQINTYYNENKAIGKSQQILQLRKMIADYKLTAKYANDIVKNGCYIYGIPGHLETSLTNYYGFQDTNLYQIRIAYNQYTYMFEHELYEYNYATPFSLSQPSNNSVNGFDYSYYALRLCSLFITVYLVVLAAGTIAGEQSAGTLKLLAIRPFSRSKLLAGKSFAIFAIGGILLAVSSVASLVIGAVTYGLSTVQVLAVFNGSSTFIISPFIIYLIAFITMYIEILFYATLSIFISTAFKSNVGAVSISTLAFFISLILNGLLTSIPAVGFLPFTNISFFKYFGSAYVANSPDFLVQILSPGVFVGATFWSSLIIYALTIGVLIYIPHLIFKTRDLK